MPEISGRVISTDPTALDIRRLVAADMGIERGDSGTKRCPDCAEQVKEAARVCRFCGYRFAPPSASGESLDSEADQEVALGTTGARASDSSRKRTRRPVVPPRIEPSDEDRTLIERNARELAGEHGLNYERALAIELGEFRNLGADRYTASSHRESTANAAHRAQEGSTPAAAEVLTPADSPDEGGVAEPSPVTSTPPAESETPPHAQPAAEGSRRLARLSVVASAGLVLVALLEVGVILSDAAYIEIDNSLLDARPASPSEIDDAASLVDSRQRA